ncbi:hypothetical protein LC76P1_00162 [Lysinibacillus phage LC76P1]|nr:hypothetical protein LC76P1_00162 [Lysinibacillus phage LC76P1]
MITYDELWSCFLDNYKINKKDIPTNQHEIYNDIRNAVRHYNVKMKALGRTQASCLEGSEMIVGVDDDVNLLILAHYLILVHLKNSYHLLDNTWQVMGADIGVKNFRTQLISLESDIKATEDKISRFIFDGLEDFGYG